MMQPRVAASARIRFTFWLDALLLILYLVEESPRVTGVAAHEALGIAIAIPIVLHLLLSWHWIVANGRRLFAGGTTRTRFNYAVNIAVFVAMFIVVISGTVISRIVLPWAGVHTYFDRGWFNLHNVTSNVLFFAVALHLSMNWGWAMAFIRRGALSAAEAEATRE